MSTLDQILGRKPAQESVVPTLVGRTRQASMSRRQNPRDEEEKKLRDKSRKASVVAHILGMTESDEEGIIPRNAQQMDVYSSPSIPGMGDEPELDSESPAEPSLTAINGEELIQPSSALVAPDVTPKIFDLIDPSQVPAPPKPTGPPPGAPTVTPASPGEEGTLDTILGRQKPSPAQGPAPVAVESFMQAINPGDIKAKVAEKLVPNTGGGASSSMPEHQEGDGRTVYNAFRSLVG